MAVQQEPRLRLLTAFQGHVPLVRRLVPVRGGDRAAELHVAAEVELVGDVVQIFQSVRLGGEVLLPVPFLHQFLGERVAIRPAFGIETGPGVTVPVPGAADVRSGLENPRRHTEFAQAVEHEHAGNPAADDDRIVFRDLILGLSFRQDVRIWHGVSPAFARAAKIRHAPRRSGGIICRRPFRHCSTLSLQPDRPQGSAGRRENARLRP